MIIISNINHLFDEIIARKFSTIGKTISLMENFHRRTNLIRKKLSSIFILYINNMQNISFFLGITGSAGAGKSSFTNILSRYIYTNFYKRISILTIDPTSPLSQGSIMGDLIRMQDVHKNPRIFARAIKTNTSCISIPLLMYDILLVFFVSGFNIIIAETIGIGQIDIDIYSLVNILCLVVQPIEGDEIQLIKKGVLELIDIVVINKSDTSTMKMSNKMRMLYINALHQSNIKKVLNISCLKNQGIDTAWSAIKKIFMSIKIKKSKSFDALLKKIIAINLTIEFFRVYKNNLWYKQERNLLLFKGKTISQLLYDLNILMR